MKVLYYCPDSSYYYDSEEQMKEMRDEWTMLKVLQEVSKLILRVSKAEGNEIQEVSSSSNNSPSESEDSS